MRLLNILIAVFVLASFIACDSLFNRGNDGPEFSLQNTKSSSKYTTFNGDSLIFEPIGYGEQPQSNPPFITEVNGSQIIIKGYYLAAAGFNVLGEFKYNNNTATIVIRADPEDQDIPSMPEGYFYDAFINNLSEGNHTVTIIHKNDLLIDPDGYQVPTEDTVFTQEFVIQ